MATYTFSSQSHLFVAEECGKNIFTWLPRVGSQIAGYLHCKEEKNVVVDQSGSIESREGMLFFLNPSVQYNSGFEEMLSEAETIWFFLNKSPEEYQAASISNRDEAQAEQQKYTVCLIRRNGHWDLCDDFEEYLNYMYPDDKTVQKKEESYYIDLDF